MALRGTGTHRKIRRLARRLNIDPCFALGIIEFIWHVTAEQQPDGGIGRLSDLDICDEIFYSGDPAQLIDALCSDDVALLDRSEECRLYVHDWHEWADDAVISKLIGRRQRFANGSIPRLSKYGKEAREKILAEYAHDNPTVLEVRNSGDRAHGAHNAQDEHGAHNAPRGRARPEPVPVPEPVPEARVQKKEKPVVSDSPAQYTLDESFSPAVELAKTFWPDWVQEDFIQAFPFWCKWSPEQRELCKSNLKLRIEYGEESRFVAKTFSRYVASSEWKRPPREPVQQRNGHATPDVANYPAYSPPKDAGVIIPMFSKGAKTK